MTTRAKSKEIVVESQKVFGVVTKGLKWIAVSLAVITVIAVTIWGIGDLRHEQKQAEKAMPSMSSTAIPLASLPQSEWPKLAISPKGMSETITLPPGMRVIWAGYRFRNYTVYPGGHTCIYSGGEPCPSGGTGTYAENETDVVNVVAYAYAPM